MPRRSPSPGAPSPPKIRAATPADLPALVALEEAAFEPHRRASARSLRRSIQRPNQSVWVTDDLDASLVLWHFPRSIRIYDVAVHPRRQGQGLGRALVRHAEQVAAKQDMQRVILEAAVDGTLRTWYEGQGYVVAIRKADFYGPGHDAWRMEKRLAAGRQTRNNGRRPQTRCVP